MDPIQNQAPIGGEVKKSHGKIIGIVVIIIVLVAGVFYFSSNKAVAPVVNTLPVVSQSDEVESINTDLGAGTGAELDIDFGDIELE